MNPSREQTDPPAASARDKARGTTPRVPRRRRNAIAALTGLASTAAIALGFAGLHALARTLDLRFDTTALGVHNPAPATLRALANAGPTELTVIADLDEPSIDPLAAQRVRDTLDELARRSPELTVRFLDPTTQRGIDDARPLLRSLADRDAAQTEQSQRLLAQAEASLRDAVERTGAIALPAELSGRVTPALAELRRRLDTAQVARARTVLDLALPDLETAAANLFSVADALPRVLNAIAQANPDLPERLLPDLVEDAARALDALAGLPDVAPATRVATVLDAEQAAVISTAAGAQAIPLGSLFPPPPADPSVSLAADAGRTAEAEILAALRALSPEPRPLVVFAHGEAGDILGQTNVLDTFADRLDRDGFDLVEWAPVREPRPPASVESPGDRPVVFFVIGTDAGADGQGAGRSGPERAAAVARAIDEARTRGHPMLVCVAPSPLPAFGEPDPVASALATLGVDASTGTPLLTTDAGPPRIVVPEHDVVARAAEHPISDSIDRLALRLPWPVPLATDAPHTRLLEAGDASSNRVWAETLWQSYRTVAPDRRAFVANPPSPDEALGETGGPFGVALAVDEAEGRPRLVVVGSNRVFFDEFTQAAGLIDGRRVRAHPGNEELLRSSLAWLAGREVVEPIARSAVPRVAALSTNGLLALRLVCGLGLPLGVIVVGVVAGPLRGR